MKQIRVAQFSRSMTSTVSATKKKILAGKRAGIKLSPCLERTKKIWHNFQITLYRIELYLWYTHRRGCNTYLHINRVGKNTSASVISAKVLQRHFFLLGHDNKYYLRSRNRFTARRTLACIRFMALANSPISSLDWIPTISASKSPTLIRSVTSVKYFIFPARR